MSDSDGTKRASGIGRRGLLRGAAGAAIGSLVAARSGDVRADQRKDVLDVAVVGAGIAGLTAARDLVKAGCTNIAVLEARGRVGGRSMNQALGFGLVADAGPTWVGPGQTAIADLLRELGIGTISNYGKGDMVVYLGGEAQRTPGGAAPVSGDFMQQIDQLAKTIPIDAPWNAPKAAEYDAMTYGDYLKTLQLSDGDKLATTIAGMLTYGAKPEHMSLLYVLFYISSAGGMSLLESMEGGAQQDRIVGGTQAISKAMAEQLGSIVRLNQPVSSIGNWDHGAGGTVRLLTPTGVVEARSVILALSPSQATNIDFAPALPTDRAALNANWPRGGSAIKVAVAYDKPFWREQGLSGQIISTDGPIVWSVDVSPPDGSKGQLMSFTAPAYTTPITAEQRKAEIIATYVKCFGDQARNPIGYVQQDWSQETYTRGCVSPLTPGVLTRYGKTLRPPTDRLIWAGTETSEIWMGYMDGAVRSGHRAALQALNDVAKG